MRSRCSCKGSSVSLSSSAILIPCHIKPLLLQIMSCGLSHHSRHMALQRTSSIHTSWRAWMNWQLLTVCRGCSGSTTPTTWDACTGESKPATYILILHSNSARSVTGSSSTVLSQVLNQGSALAQLVSPLAESSGLWWQIWHCSVRITACEVADGHVSFKDMPAT